MLLNIILYILCVYGIATIISSEYIFSLVIDKFKKYKTLYYLLTCNKCMTVWVGFIVSLLGFGIISPIVDPFIAYTCTLFLNKFLEDPEI